MFANNSFFKIQSINTATGMLELGGLLLVGRLVGKKNFILSKKLDQVGGRGKVSVTWSYQAQILEKQLPPYNGRR
jgi:hypothetical protein